MPSVNPWYPESSPILPEYSAVTQVYVGSRKQIVTWGINKLKDGWTEPEASCGADAHCPHRDTHRMLNWVLLLVSFMPFAYVQDTMIPKYQRKPALPLGKGMNGGDSFKI